MANKPPTRANRTNANAPHGDSHRDPLLSSLEFLSALGEGGLVVAPLDPPVAAVAAAAREADITPTQAMRAYRILAGISTDRIH